MTLKRTLIGLCEQTGLIEAVNEVRGLSTLARPSTLLGNARARRQGAPDGLPIPPARLIYLVAGTYSVEWFLELGRAGAAAIEETLARHGIDIARLQNVLDFGCGCGRVLRYFVGRGQMQMHGTDYNPLPIAWCRENLAPARFELNQLAPPLPYPAQTFDLIYALSVFTHLDEPLQEAWLDELRRVCKPGGHILFTLHGASYLGGLSEQEQARFAAHELVVRRRDLPGKNICTTFASERYVRDRLTRGGELVDFLPQGARGNPTQDLYLLRVAESPARDGVAHAATPVTPVLERVG